MSKKCLVSVMILQIDVGCFFFFLNPLHLYFNKSFAKEIGRRNVCNEPQNCDFQVVPQKFVYNPLRENSTRYTVESLLTAGQCLDGARNRIKTYTMLQPLPPLPTTTRTTRHHGHRHYCHRHCHPHCCRHCHHHQPLPLLRTVNYTLYYPLVVSTVTVCPV